jgi:hypothetical protein
MAAAEGKYAAAGIAGEIDGSRRPSTAIALGFSVLVPPRKVE